MRHNKLALYVHFVWSTWDRAPLIGPEVERRLWRILQAEAVDQGCTLIAIGDVEDHVHLLMSFPATISLSHLVKQIKGVSSLFANRELGFEGSFKWQASYAALSVSRWDVKHIRGYIQNQRIHHSTGTLKPELELRFEADSL